MTDAALDEAGEDAADGAVDPPSGRMGMADRYTIAAQQASRAGVRVTAQSQETSAAWTRDTRSVVVLVSREEVAFDGRECVGRPQPHRRVPPAGPHAPQESSERVILPSQAFGVAQRDVL